MIIFQRFPKVWMSCVSLHQIEARTSKNTHIRPHRITTDSFHPPDFQGPKVSSPKATATEVELMSKGWPCLVWKNGGETFQSNTGWYRKYMEIWIREWKIWKKHRILSKKHLIATESYHALSWSFCESLCRSEIPMRLQTLGCWRQ